MSNKGSIMFLTDGAGKQRVEKVCERAVNLIDATTNECKEKGRNC
jgi:hypothetical protein